jgi:hypothetical protein
VKNDTPTTESRLERLEAIADNVLLAIQQQSQAVQSDIQSTQTEMKQSVKNVAQMIEELAESAAEDRKLIIGLQAKNQRVLDYLLNQK